MVVITTKKPVEEVIKALKNNNIKKVVLISCGVCSALCQTGGTEGLEEWKGIIEKEGIQILNGVVVDDVCDNREMKTILRKIENEVEKADAIVTLSCGLGVQSIVTTTADKHPKMKVFVTNNTEFMGMTERIGRFYMRCIGCGDCLLNETGGICPLTTCAKSLMNGPCGGMVDGKCEVGKYEKDCGWILIYNRLKAIDRLDLFGKFREARNWKDSGHQREVCFR